MYEYEFKPPAYPIDPLGENVPVSARSNAFYSNTASLAIVALTRVPMISPTHTGRFAIGAVLEAVQDSSEASVAAITEP